MKTPYWTRAITRAIAKLSIGLPPFTTAQKKRAEDWVTCACGKQNQRILRRDHDNAPFDDILRFLGFSFSLAVTDEQPLNARDILAKIENRVAHISGNTT